MAGRLAFNTDQPERSWGTDMTSTVTAVESSARVLVAAALGTRSRVGLRASRRGDHFVAS